MRRAGLNLGVLIALAMVAAQALLIPLFAAPAAHLAPRDLPIAVAGPPPVAARLTAGHPGAFTVVTVADAAAADQKIKDRLVYGAVLVTSSGAEVHVASAASPAVATLLTQAAASLGTDVPVRDVVPLAAKDPRGAAFAAGFLPLGVTSLLAGVLIFMAVRRRAARAFAVVAFGVLSGAGSAAVLHYWLAVLPGGYLPLSGALGLFAAALAGAMVGLGSVFGPGGLPVGGLVLFLAGNALSGLSAAPELLPQPWGAVGQWLPIGAGGTLLRSVAYFDGQDSARAVAVLTSYIIGGLILLLIGGRSPRLRPGPTVTDAALEAVAVI